MRAWLAAAATALLLASPAPATAEPSILESMQGVWSGRAVQTDGRSDYHAVVAIDGERVASNYPELDCGGDMIFAGAVDGYAFFAERITHGGLADGGGCIDGAATMKRVGDAIVWGWVGEYQGQPFLAWGRLTRDKTASQQ